jgi:hypothetical protein
MKSYEKYKQVSPTFLQTVTDTRRYLLSVMCILSGLYMIAGLITMVVIRVGVSGDSTMQKRNAIAPLSTPPSAEIR